MLRLLRSTSVRLALGYAVLFVASSLLLVSLLWWAIVGYLGRETEAAIRSDTQAIRDELTYRGATGAVDTIKERVGAAFDGHAIYLLTDPALKPVAGNLGVWPPEVKPKPGWYQVSLFRNDGLHVFQIEEVALPDGSHLLVGRDIQDKAEIRRLVVDGLGWAAAGAFVIAIAGGLLVRRRVLRRVESINRAATAIVQGDFSRRLAIRNTSDEFDQLAQTINLMLSQIEKLVDSVRNTSNAVAHDLRTPLAELRAQLEELTRTHPSRDAMLDSVNKAVGDIDHIISIFNALLRLTEINSGVRRAGFRQIDLAEVATEVAELYGPLMEEKGADFTVDAPGGLTVSGDPYLLAQAIGNLVDNAVKFTPPHGSIILRVTPSGDRQIQITVADNGPGIPDADKPRATERFYRCQRDGGADGIGLGLSLVEAVARLHGGELSLADNDPGLLASLTIPATNISTSLRAAGAEMS